MSGVQIYHSKRFSRCKRHSTIFGAPWPSRMPLWTPPFPSPSPEPTPREVLGSKRHLTCDHHSNERAAKRLRSDAGYSEGILDNKHLTKQDLKRLRKNERRRIARAKAREEREAVRRALGSNKEGVIEIDDAESAESSDEDERVTLQTVLRSWEEGFSLLDRTVQARQCSSLFTMKRTPDLLSRRFWMRLSWGCRTSDVGNPPEDPTDGVSEGGSNSGFSSDAEDDNDSFLVARVNGIDSRPSSFACRKRNLHMYPSAVWTVEANPKNEGHLTRTKARITYQSSSGTHKSCRLKQKSVLQQQLTEGTRSCPSQTLADPMLGQARSMLGQLTYDDGACYEGSEDRLDICKDLTRFWSSRKEKEPPDPSGWSFHTPYVPREVHRGELSEECTLEETCQPEAELLPGVRVERASNTRRRLSLKIGEPPWYGANEATSENHRDKTGSDDLSERKTGCEYPSLEGKLEFRTSFGFEPPSREEVEVGLKGAQWKES